MTEPRKRKDTTLQYYAYRWPRLFTGLNILLCPFTCGCFYCLSHPSDEIASDLKKDGPPVHERMADMHFERQGRKFLRRNSLSIDKTIWKTRPILKRQKRPSNQALSPLFAKLPYEIRIQIYEYATSYTGAVWIFTLLGPDRKSFHKLMAMQCLLNTNTETKFQVLTETASGVKKANRLNTALLQTCRLAYSEALPILYSSNQFVFNDPSHLVAFSHSIPATHFEKIRSIRFDYFKISLSTYIWDPATGPMRAFIVPLRKPMQESLAAIRSLRYLRSLDIIFRIHSERDITINMEALLKELKTYYGKVREATHKPCRVRMLFWVCSELFYEITERGVIELEENGDSGR